MAQAVGGCWESRKVCNTREHGVAFCVMTRRERVLTKAERSLTPLAVRFLPKDLEAFRALAYEQGEVVTVLLREVTLLRVTAIEKSLDRGRLFLRPVGEALSAVISVRFRPADHRRVARAAAKEKMPMGLWVRAVALEYLLRHTASAASA